MAIDVLVPDLGDFKDVEVIDVLVKPGDTVEVDTPLITLETEKATMDVPSTSAGTVKITPAAIEDPADAPVCTMLFSRMCPPPSTRSTAIDTTAAGIAVAIVSPAKSPRYVFAAAKIIASTIDKMTARGVSCGPGEVFMVVLVTLCRETGSNLSRAWQGSAYQPHCLPWFCSSSQVISGAK